MSVVGTKASAEAFLEPCRETPIGGNGSPSLCDPEGRHLNVLRTEVTEQQDKVLCSFSRGRIETSPNDMVPKPDREKDDICM